MNVNRLFLLKKKVNIIDSMEEILTFQACYLIVTLIGAVCNYVTVYIG